MSSKAKPAALATRRALKIVIHLPASDSPTNSPISSEIQSRRAAFVARRFGLPSARADLIAGLAFVEDAR